MGRLTGTTPAQSYREMRGEIKRRGDLVRSNGQMTLTLVFPLFPTGGRAVSNE